MGEYWFLVFAQWVQQVFVMAIIAMATIALWESRFRLLWQVRRAELEVRLVTAKLKKKRAELKLERLENSSAAPKEEEEAKASSKASSPYEKGYHQELPPQQ